MAVHGPYTTQPIDPKHYDLHKEETGKPSTRNPNDHTVNVYRPAVQQPAASGGSGRGSGAGSGGAGGAGGAAAPAQAQTGGGADAGAALLAAFLAAQQQARDEAYRLAQAQQQREYEAARGELNAQTDKALQEAYLNKMLSLLRLPQDMAAQGLGGGAAESTIGSLHNQYGKARNELEAGRQTQLAKLLNSYQNNLAQLSAERLGGAQAALNAYTTQLAKQMASNTPALLTLSQGAADGSANLYYRLRKLLGWDEEG